MTDLKCCKCGNSLDSLPKHCGHDMIVNEETGQLECHMGPECGYVPLDEVICDSCK